MSIITIYRKCKIQENKNFVVEKLSQYLTSLNNQIFNSSQYIKHNLNIEVKIAVSQNILRPVNINEFNYCSISNNTNEEYYYFIKDMEWTAKQTVKLILKMDVLNTYNDKFTFNEKTYIERQHKDRFKIEPGNRIIFLEDEEKTTNNGKWYYFKDQRINSGHPQLTLYYDDRIKINFKILDTNMNEILNSNEIEGNAKKVQFDVDNQKVLFLNGADVIYALSYGESYHLFIKFTYFDNTNDTYLSCEQGYLSNQIIKRIVDEESEGIHPLLHGEDKAILEEDDSKWFMLYKTNGDYSTEEEFNSNLPLKVYLLSDKPQTVKIPTANVEIAPENLESGKYYYFSLGVNDLPKSIPDDYDGIGTYATTFSYNYNSNLYEKTIDVTPKGKNAYRQKGVILHKKDATTIEFTITQLNRDSGEIAGQYTRGECSKCYFRNSKVTLFATTARVLRWAGILASEYYSNTEDFTTSTNTYETKTIYDVDRTDPKLISIIELPYNPADLQNLYYDSAEKMLTFNEGVNNTITQVKLNRTIIFNVDETPFDVFYVDIGPTINDLRNDENESKLFHSDYWQYKFIYDSNAYTFINEYYVGDYSGGDGNFVIDFVASSNGGSNIAFRFPQYVTNKQFEHYEVLCANRNNNVAIYNSNYFNYLKVGINQDVKSRSQQMNRNVGLTAVSLVGTIASLVGTIASGGQAAPLLIGFATTTIASISNLISQDIQSEKAMQDKLENLKNQAASISGSDDLDIFNFYADGNKAKLMLWTCSENMKKNIADLFYYCGYKCGYRGLPIINNRVWFNYIQCTPEFEINFNSVYFDENIKNEIVSKYQNGVTYLHENSGTIDFEQEKENWETLFFEN